MTVGGEDAAYEQRYLAFVDILGFADLVDRSRSSTHIVTQLRDALSSVSALAQAARSDELKIEATSFSDTVVLSSAADINALLRMIEIIDQFSVTLISKNMLFRGALVCGEALHSPQFIFGPALVAAYRLEAGTSFHPRIMFDATVFAAAKSDKRFTRYIVADPYDVPYLNPFARWETGKPLTKKALAELVQLQSVIAAGLMAGAEAPSVGEKYKWLARKLNQFIEGSKPKSSLRPLQLT